MNPIPPQYRDWEKNDYEHPRGAGADKEPAPQRRSVA
jgi:hypothetical protein